MTNISPGFSIIHSNKLEDLRYLAVQWVVDNPLEPLENELFIVQSNGMAQWIKLALAENDDCGICAAVDMQLPARFLWGAYRAVLGPDTIPTESPFDKNRLIWRILRMLPDLLKDDFFLPLKHFLSDDDDQRKRYQLATHLADLFDQYQVYRADWLEGWAEGLNVIFDSCGKSVHLSDDKCWQSELWRRILNDVPQELIHTSRSSLHVNFLQNIDNNKNRPVGLPRRLIVFGVSSLPQQFLEALHRLSCWCQILLFVHNPCKHYWADIIEDRHLLRIINARHIRKKELPEDLSPELQHQYVNPLLAAWGKQGRDYIGLLYGYDQPESYRENFSEIDLFSDFVDTNQKNSILNQVQQAILDLQPIPLSQKEKLSVLKSDRSITFQLAHSRMREVEILHDQLLNMFEQDPELKPRDIIVMMPDVASYSSFIESVFSDFSYDDSCYIPYTIADNPDKPSTQLIAAIEKLLHLPELRLTVNDLMELLEIQPFRDRFSLTSADLPVLLQWISESGIRWGLNPKHRTSFDLPDGLELNTWMFGIKRMLLGYAVGNSAVWNNIAPYDEVAGLDARLAGSLALILTKIEDFLEILKNPASPEKWCRRISELLRSFLLPTKAVELLTIREFENLLRQWLEECNDAELYEKLTLQVVRDVLLTAMNKSNVSQRFLAGKLNFCSMMPMRAIPFKVVCLLGMNDGEYPRYKPTFDFDLMSLSGNFRPGDRSCRDDDRYLFLEALLSARKKLYISYLGRSIRDNSIRMPSVLVGQLQDYLEAGWELSNIDEKSYQSNHTLLQHLICQHPLQPFSRKYFQESVENDLFTYAHDWREIFEKNSETSHCFDLKDDHTEFKLQAGPLIRFMKDPVKFFYNNRLDVYFDDTDERRDNLEAFNLDFFAHFGLGDQLLKIGLSAEISCREQAITTEAERLLLSGELPISGFGELAAAELISPVLKMLEFNDQLEETWPQIIAPIEVHFPIKLEDNSGFLDDQLPGLRAEKEIKNDLSEPKNYARWEFYHKEIMDKGGSISRFHTLIPLWVRHLTGCANGINLTSMLIASDGVAKLVPLQKEEAKKYLEIIIKYFKSGMISPLPVTAKSALAYHAELQTNKKLTDEQRDNKAKSAASKAFQGDGFNSQGELGYNLYLLKEYPSFNDLWRADNNLFSKLASEIYSSIIEVADRANKT